jgi:hypothetical protein
MEVQMLLADQRQHPATAIPDLLVAAVAEIAGQAALSVGKGCDLIAQITGQSVERLTL